MLTISGSPNNRAVVSNSIARAAGMWRIPVMGLQRSKFQSVTLVLHCLTSTRSISDDCRVLPRGAVYPHSISYIGNLILLHLLRH